MSYPQRGSPFRTEMDWGFLAHRARPCQMDRSRLDRPLRGCSGLSLLAIVSPSSSESRPGLHLERREGGIHIRPHGSRLSCRQSRLRDGRSLVKMGTPGTFKSPSRGEEKCSVHLPPVDRLIDPSLCLRDDGSPAKKAGSRSGEDRASSASTFRRSAGPPPVCPRGSG